MIDYGRIEELLASGVGLEHRPVAVTFLPGAPAGVEKFEGVRPSGCSFWKLASAGRTFYTVSADHYNCPIGSYTHSISLPPERARELDDTLGFMASVGYLRMEEVPQIARLAETPGVVVYAPLAQTPVDPDVALFWGPPGKIDGAPGGRHPRRGRTATGHAGSTDLHDPAGGAQPGHCRQHRVYRQSRLHRTRRSGSLFRRSRSRPNACRRGNSRCLLRKRHAVRLSPEAEAGAGSSALTPLYPLCQPR